MSTLKEQFEQSCNTSPELMGVSIPHELVLAVINRLDNDSIDSLSMFAGQPTNRRLGRAERSFHDLAPFFPEYGIPADETSPQWKLIIGKAARLIRDARYHQRHSRTVTLTVDEPAA